MLNFTYKILQQNVVSYIIYILMKAFIVIFVYTTHFMFQFIVCSLERYPQFSLTLIFIKASWKGSKFEQSKFLE